MWELEINIIPLNYLWEFAKYFHVSLDYVLGLSNNKKSKYKNEEFNLNILGDNIKKLRMKKKLSQESLAQMLNVSQVCITKYEKGLICISIPNLVIISDTFKVSIDYLCNKKIT